MATNEQNRTDPGMEKEVSEQEQPIDFERMTAEEIKAYFDEAEPVTDEEFEKFRSRMEPRLLKAAAAQNRRSCIRSSRKARRVLMAAATLTLVFSMLAVQAFDPSLWDSIGFWTQEHLDVEVYPEGCVNGLDGNRVYSAEERATWGDEVCSALEEMGIHTPLPTWMPEGLELDKLDYRQDEDGYVFLNAEYLSSDGEFLHFCLERIPGTLYEFQDAIERDVSYRKNFTMNEIEYHSISNNDQSTIAWYWDSFSFTISGSLDPAPLERMISSIQ